MDNNGHHDPKRQRVGHTGSWPSHDSARQLPPLRGRGSPFSRAPGHEPHQPSNPLDIRRNSDQPHVPPYEDPHRRPSSGPGPYHGSSLPHNNHQSLPYNRDMLIKEEHNSPYRPNSTTNGHDHLANTPHTERQSQHYSPNPQPQGSQLFQSTRPPPPHFHHSDHSQPPNSPMPVSEPYSQPYTPHGLPAQFSSVSYPSTSTAVKRKAQRAAQACDSCRTLKAKCDEGRPGCSSCRDKGVPCTYRDPPPKQQDKSATELVESLIAQQTNDKLQILKFMGELSDQINGLSKQVSRLERSTNLSDNSIQPKNEDREEIMDTKSVLGRGNIPLHASADEANDSTASEFPYTSASSIGPHRSPQRLPSNSEHLMSIEVADGVQDEEVAKSESEQGEPVPPHPPTIPVNHTTGASRLLLIGPIEKMLKGKIHNSRVRNEMYPMVHEERRGLLRLYGRGEGVDRPPGFERDHLDSHTDTTSPEATRTPGSEASSPPGELWGQCGGMTPPGDDHIAHIPRGNVINAQGMPDFNRTTVTHLVDSYIHNIHNMHPILAPQHLNALVEDFLRSMPEHAKSRQVETVKAAGFVGAGGRSLESPSNKRKRSPGSTMENPDLLGFLDHKPGHPFRSIRTALVLLVLALGAVCEYKDRLPDISSDRDHGHDTSSSPTARNGYPQSPAQSSPLITNSTGLPSPRDAMDFDGMQTQSRRTSLDYPRSKTVKPKNLDQIRGLAYFALATDIIGNQIGGNTLQHVHANILASLYHGQLGRVLESHAYLHNACRSIQVILRPKLDRFKSLAEATLTCKPADNPLVLAFWTCLQLESDILAELPVPPSGVLNFEEVMPQPDLLAVEAGGYDGHILQSYSAQLWLRRHLNKLHGMFYKPTNRESDSSPKQAGKVFQSITEVEDSLDSARRIFSFFKWDETEDPAKNILAARLRAKYYGAKVITYRNYVLKILENSENGAQVSDDFKDGLDVPRFKATGETDPQVLKYAEKGIAALIQSTTAFHNVVDTARERLIVTNIWGTAHAQWGNVLTLIAASKDPQLSAFIDKDILTDLFQKTVAFLAFNAQRPGALATDCDLLQHAGAKAGLYSSKVLTNVSSSFNSSSSSDVVMADPSSR